MRVAFYGRYSSDNQSEASIRQQFQIVREWCKRNGYRIVAVYRDYGYSGSNLKRPAFQRMNADSQLDRFDLVVTHKLNRLSRNLADVILTVNAWQNQPRKVLYASATEIFDCTSMMGKIILVLLAFFAEWYLTELSAETHRGKHHRVANKRLQNNLPPFGYEYLGKDTPPKPHSEAAPAMQHVYAMRVTYRYTNRRIQAHELNATTAKQLHSDADCAKWLNEQGHRTRKGREFSADGVGDLLSNPFFAGWARETELIEGKTKGGKKKRSPRRAAKLHSGAHEPLVDQPLFDLVAKTRAFFASNPSGRSANPDRVYLLGDGLAVCSSCGQPMNCHAIYDGGGVPAYHCKARIDCDAPRSFVRQSFLMPQLDELMTAFELPETMRQHIAEMVDTNNAAAHLADELAELNDTATRLDARLDMKRISADEYRKQMAKLQQRIQFVQDQMAAAPAHAEIAIEQFEGMVTAWQIADEREKGDLLQALFDGVRVDVRRKTIAAYRPKNDFRAIFAASTAFEAIGQGWFKATKNGLTAIDNQTVDTEVTGIHPSPNHSPILSSQSTAFLTLTTLSFAGFISPFWRMSIAKP